MNCFFRFYQMFSLVNKIQYNTIQYKTYNAPYVTKMLFVGAGRLFHNNLAGTCRWWEQIKIKGNYAYFYSTYKKRPRFLIMLNCIKKLIISFEVIGSYIEHWYKQQAYHCRSWVTGANISWIHAGGWTTVYSKHIVGRHYNNLVCHHQWHWYVKLTQ